MWSRLFKYLACLDETRGVGTKRRYVWEAGDEDRLEILSRLPSPRKLWFHPHWATQKLADSSEEDRLIPIKLALLSSLSFTSTLWLPVCTGCHGNNVGVGTCAGDVCRASKNQRRSHKKFSNIERWPNKQHAHSDDGVIKYLSHLLAQSVCVVQADRAATHDYWSCSGPQSSPLGSTGPPFIPGTNPASWVRQHKCQRLLLYWQ